MEGILLIRPTGYVDVEQKEVQRHETANQSDVQQEEKRKIGLDPFFDFPGGQYCNWEDQQREQDEYQADAVQAEVKLDVEQAHVAEFAPQVHGEFVAAVDVGGARR